MANIKIEVKKLQKIPNICNQILREAWKSRDVSVAYVEMAAGNVSLLHKHNTFRELYYILSGKGILWVGNKKLSVGRDTLVEIKPGMPHKLENIGKSVLKHLVISSPAFNPEDVVLIEER